MISDVQSSSQDDIAGSSGEYDASASRTNTAHTSGTSTNHPTTMAQLQLAEDPGHLMFGPQTKTRYISPAHFAMISEEVLN